MYVDLTPKRLVFALALLAAFASYAPDFTSSATEIAAALVTAFFLSGYLSHIYKHYFYSRMVLFDIHGVLLAGDLDYEAFREMPGMKGLVEKLRDNYKVGALTNMGPDMFQFYSTKFGLGGNFDYVMHSGRAKVKKPDPGIYKATLQEANASPASTIFIDDILANVEAAKKLGMDGIHFQDPKQLVQELRMRGIRI